ncbi:uncharacterized protein LOC124414930 [Diprion similis]|uniref:uncharacterized protein LOC124414930 n=1 Tax=Diprion similis TaxID=362088 RepID=UPI001EF8220A|nr:uncharacterized protein LOC124414930 [Diprion similis]XP_046752076.1 uncharacterized protein LOC124414930 [Diprion similis]
MSSALYCSSRCIMHTNYRRLNVTAFIKKNNNNTDLAKYSRKFAVNSVLSYRTPSTHRYFSTQQNENIKKPDIPLMDFPTTSNPAIFQLLKSFLAVKFGIPRIDREFDLDEFMTGSKQAVLVVSNALSREDYESLEGLVTPDAIKILKDNVSRMSDEQKAEIGLDSKEFLFYCPISINIRNDKSSKIVEILMLYHFLRNWKSSQEDHSDDEEPISPMERLQVVRTALHDPAYLQHAICCNYRFVRQYGHMDSSWLIDIVSQCRLCDVKE